MERYKRYNERYYARTPGDSVIAKQLYKHAEEGSALDVANVVINSIQSAFEGRGERGSRGMFYKSILDALLLITKEIK